MDRLINTIGMAIIFAKYTVFVLLAGLTVATGVNAADPSILLVLENNE